MWCIEARRLGPAAALLGALVVLAGCGFEPLYAKRTGNAVAALGGVAVAPIADRTGQKLRNLLAVKLNPRGAPARPAYRLAVRLFESRQELGLRKDETATRANLTLRAVFSLRRASDGVQVYNSAASSTNSYNILQSEFATLSAANDARTRAVRDLSEEIKIRLALFLRKPRSGQARPRTGS
jgi:LPS-assembly lipoprotein